MNLEHVKVGSPLSFDVHSGGRLLVAKGTIVTESMLKTLQHYNIAVSVQQDDTWNIESMTTRQNMLLQRLDLDRLVEKANGLVDSLLSGTYAPMLHLMYDYDACTYTHTKNVTLLALLAAIEMQYSVDDLRNIALGAILHDIGKLEVPLSILDKPGRLTPEEFAVVQKHPRIGYEMIADAGPVSSAVKQIVLQHHENFDGSGYPMCLDRHHGYRHARLVHICDVYEAMCAKRPYKLPMPREQVREFIQSKTGTMFDPELVRKFLDVVPAYLVGEELSVNGISCIVQNTCSSLNPIVMYNGVTCTLNELKKMAS